MIYLAVIFLISGLALLILLRRQQKAAGVPDGRIIYSDTHSWGRSEQVLYDPELKLAGKPDYLVRQGSQIIPVEVKSSQAGDVAYPNHVFQLAAYCRLVESSFNQRPKSGILHYSNKTFAIDYSHRLESDLLKLLREIRLQDQEVEVARSHDLPARCRACGYRSVCDQKLN